MLLEFTSSMTGINFLPFESDTQMSVGKSPLKHCFISRPYGHRRTRDGVPVSWIEINATLCNLSQVFLSWVVNVIELSLSGCVTGICVSL